MSSLMLSSDLSSLISESKRKKPDLRKAAEMSLATINAHKDSDTSALGSALSGDKTFPTPFLLACSTGESKFVRSGINGMLQLLALHGVHPDQLEEVLSALEPSISLGQEVQLRVLQCLQKLDENYSSDIRGLLMTRCLNICTALRTKGNATVAHISIATFQQLIVSLFDAIDLSQNSVRRNQAKTSSDSAAVDGYDILRDLCFALADIQAPTRLATHASSAQALEMIDIILGSNIELFRENKDFSGLVENNILPFLIEHLSERDDFQRVCRIVRLARHIIQHYIEQFPDQCGAAVSEISYHLVLEENPFWKRVVCLEMFVDLYSTKGFIRRLFTAGAPDSDTETSLLGHHLSSLVRISQVSPEALGWGSSPHITSKDSDILNGNSGLESPHEYMLHPHNMIGSTPKTRCLDQMDKGQPIELPQFYAHNLVLRCAIQMCLDFDKSIIKCAFSQDLEIKKRKGKTPSSQEFLDPLRQQNNPLLKEMQIYLAVLDKYHNSILKILGIFLSAVFDEDLYIDFAASIRRLGVVLQIFKFNLAVSRVLSLLSQGCFPIRELSWAKQTLDAADGESYVSELGHHRLVCIKTILEIAISIGFLIQSNIWRTMLEVLAQASEFDYQGFAPESGCDKEVAQLLDSGIERFLSTTIAMQMDAIGRVLQGFVSSLQTALDYKNNPVNLDKSSRLLKWLFQLVSKNSVRITDSTENCQVLLDPFTVACDIIEKSKEDTLRLATAGYLNSAALNMVDTAKKPEVRDIVFELLLSTVSKEIVASGEHMSYKHELHRQAFDTLSAFIQSSGENLSNWSTVFELISTAFLYVDDRTSVTISASFKDNTNDLYRPVETRSLLLVQIGYSILRLVCADFRESIIKSSLEKCTKMLRAFASQQTDLNISLEALSTFWSFGSDLVGRTESYLGDLSIAGQNKPTQSKERNTAIPSSTISNGTDTETLTPRSYFPAVHYVGKQKVDADKIIRQWTYAIDALVCLTLDSRPNIRTTSVQMLIKILEMRKDYTDLLAFDAIFRLLEINLTPVREFKEGVDSKWGSKDEWLRSISVALEQTSLIIRRPMPGNKHLAAFQQSCVVLLDYLALFVETRWLEVVSVVMVALNRLVSQNMTGSTHDDHVVKLAWKIWCDAAFITGPGPSVGLVQPHDAQLAWAKCFSSLRAKAALTTKEIITSLRLFETGLRLGLLPKYASDLESVSPFQAEALQALIATDSNDDSSIQIAIYFSVTYSTFGLIMFGKDSSTGNSTFFAFSKASIENLRTIVAKHSRCSAIYATGLLLFDALEMLSRCIQIKNENRSGGSKGEYLWKKATLSAQDILTNLFQAIQTIDIDPRVRLDIFSGAVMVIHAICFPGKAAISGANDAQDESTDIQIVRQLHLELIRAVGLDKKFGRPLAYYSLVLYEGSKVHSLEPARIGLEDAPLELLRAKPRRGRTFDVVSRRRQEIPFACLGLLVDLILEGSNLVTYQNARQLFLAKCSEALSSYRADQPLRGSKPTPKSYRRELIVLLEALIRVHRESSHDEKICKVWSQESAALLPLVTQAIAAAQKDIQLLKLLSQACFFLGRAKGVQRRGEGDPTPKAKSYEVQKSSKSAEAETVRATELPCGSVALLYHESGGPSIAEREAQFRKEMRDLQHQRSTLESDRAKKSSLYQSSD